MMNPKTYDNDQSASWIRGTERYHVVVLVAISLAVRIAVIESTEVPILAWRPTEMASIALNYYRTGFDFLHPQIQWGGNGSGYVEMEFPMIPFLTACLYPVFGVHDWVDLVIPVLSGVGVVIVTYAFTRYLFGSSAALIAGVFTTLSPTMVGLTTSLWPDPPMVFFAALGVHLLTRWVDSNRTGHLVWGGMASGMAILLKLTALFIGFPILYLCVLKYKSRWWRTSTVWFLGAIILVPSILWYWHAHNLYLQTRNTFGILSVGYLKFGTSEILWNPGFYGHLVFRMAMYHVTPVAFILLVCALLLRQHDTLAYVVHIWLAAVLIYLLVAARGVLTGHYQYMLPVVPAATPLAAFGAVSLLGKLRLSNVGSDFRKMVVTMAVPCLYLATAAGANLLYLERGVYSEGGWQHDRKTGLAVGQVTRPGSLIIVVDNQMDEFPPERSMTPPNVFYYSDRKGWYQSMAWLSPGRIEQIRSLGAKYLVVTGNSVESFETSFPLIRSYLVGHFDTILKNQDGVVFDLGTNRDCTQEKQSQPTTRSSVGNHPYDEELMKGAVVLGYAESGSQSPRGRSC